MGWLREALAALTRGEAVQVRPRGSSMRGRIEDGQEVVLAPVSPADVRKGDVVLAQWKGTHILHLVHEAEPDRLLIGNTLGKVNGWVPRHSIVGRVLNARHPGTGAADHAT